MPQTCIVPIGAGYIDTFPGFVQAALAFSQHPRVYLLVLPIAYASDAFTTTPDDFLANFQVAEKRRRELELCCHALLPEGRSCEVALLPIFNRATALSAEALNYLPPDLAGVYFLGGDQTIAMQILAATPLEEALAAAFGQGVPMGGNSAGLAIFSQVMIAGYTSEEYDFHNALQQGAVAIWNHLEKRGLSFGCTSALLEQHFWELARLPRLLNALAHPDVPHVAVGVDAFTGTYLLDNRIIEGAFGLYNITILDAETYGAAHTARYVGAKQTLSMHNVLVHLLAEGDFRYDLATRHHSLAAPPTQIPAWTMPSLPSGAGRLLLSGGRLTAELLHELNTLCGGDEAVLWLGAVGYADERLAQAALAQYATGLRGKVMSVVVKDTEISLPSELTGMCLIGEDASLCSPAPLQSIVAQWQAGVPLLLDGAATALVGMHYAAHPPTPFHDVALMEKATEGSFLAGNVQIQRGLGLLPVQIEPHVMHANRWGYLFALAYQHPTQLAIGIAAETALDVSEQGTVVRGSNGVFVLNLQHATLTLGTNQAYVIANGLLDVFGEGERVDQAQGKTKTAGFENQAPFNLK